MAEQVQPKVQLAHGGDRLVLVVVGGQPEQRAAVQLTPDQAEQLGVDLIRESGHARNPVEVQVA